MLQNSLCPDFQGLAGGFRLRSFVEVQIVDFLSVSAFRAAMRPCTFT
jgi:hypothetical protein